MSILSVDQIQPIGSGTTVTVNKIVTLESGNTNITGVTTISHTGSNQLVIKDSDTSGTNSQQRISFRDSADTEMFFVGNNTTNSWLYLGSPSGQNNNVAFRINGNDRFQVNGNGAEVVGGSLYVPDSIIHVGDTNTKIRFPTNDQFSIETAGSQRLLARADGRIQITSGNFEVIGAEGGNAEIRLTADEGDDGADYWRVQSAASGNNLNIASYASGSWVDKVSIASNGEVWFKDGKIKLGTTSGTDNYIYSTNAAGIIYQADENGHRFQTYVSGWQDRLTITDAGKHGFNRSTPHYAMHLSPADGESRIDLHMTNDTTGHNNNRGVQFGYQNSGGAYIWNFEDTNIYFGTNNISRLIIETSSSTTFNFRPNTNNVCSLGTNSHRWANIHTNDLNLSNEGSVNEVDGTWGQYTIQEGEHDLFLINRRSGKRYKFLLQEVN